MKNIFGQANPNQDKRSIPSSPKKRIFRSEELFQGEREIVITHGVSEYRLQITKAGKLILNK